MTQEFVEQILNKFAKNLIELKNKELFSVNYITKQEYFYQFQCHARVLGVLVKIGHDLGFIVDVERGLSYYDKYDKDEKKEKNAKPDVCLLIAILLL